MLQPTSRSTCIPPAHGLLLMLRCQDSRHDCLQHAATRRSPPRLGARLINTTTTRRTGKKRGCCSIYFWVAAAMLAFTTPFAALHIMVWCLRRCDLLSSRRILFTAAHNTCCYLNISSYKPIHMATGTLHATRNKILPAGRSTPSTTTGTTRSTCSIMPLLEHQYRRLLVMEWAAWRDC
jgi:hypothetical protein